MEDENANFHLLTSQLDDNVSPRDSEDSPDSVEIDRPLCYVPSSHSAGSTKTRNSDENSISSSDFEKDVPVVKKELMRINTCAIFQKLTPGRGVPHSFIGFVRQWPSLPRVVVRFIFSLTTRGFTSYRLLT